MAIYHYSVKMVKRSEGRNAVACVAYRSGESITDRTIDKTFDYQNRSGVIHTKILTPHNAPDWASDRSELWNQVEAAENRKDAQVAREVVVALPHELDQEERVKLVEHFAEWEFAQRGMVADVAIHAPDAQGDQRNFHAHIMLTTRSISEEGFGKKARHWNDKNLVRHGRERWAGYVNDALEKGGFESRVDHRSFEDQGLDKKPTKHMGWYATDMERDGGQSRQGDINRLIVAENIKRSQNQSNGFKPFIGPGSDQGIDH